MVSGPASHSLAGAGPGRLGPGQSSQTCPAFPPGQARAASWGSSKTGTVILLPSDGCRDGEWQTEERTSHVVMPGLHGKIPLLCRGPGEGDHMTTDWTTGHIHGKSQRGVNEQREGRAHSCLLVVRGGSGREAWARGGQGCGSSEPVLG